MRARRAALVVGDYDAAERLAMSIALAHPASWLDFKAKMELLVELMRPEALGEDQPERHLLLAAAPDVDALTRRRTNDAVIVPAVESET